MTTVPLGINIVTDSAVEGVRNLDALVPAAQRVESAVDKMSSSALADLKAVSQQGFAQLNTTALASLAALEKMARAKPIPSSLPSETDRAAAAFEKFKTSVDATYRAEMELAQAQRTVDAALKSGAINAEQAATAMRQYDAAVSIAGNHLGGNQSLAGKVQNASFQLADFAVQVGAGTSASVALAQQLPQLLGGFGVLGAVLGAVVAVGVPVATSMLGIGAGAKNAEDAANDLAKSAQMLISANETLMQSNADLVASYGRNAEAMREVQRVQADLAGLDFAEKMRSTVASLTDTFGDLQARMSPAEAEAGWDAYTKVLYTTRDALNTTEAEAAKVVAAIRGLENAEGAENQARASLELARAMADAAGGADNLTGSAAELYRALTGLADAGYSAASSIDATASATERAAAAAQNGIAAYAQFQRVMEAATAAQAKFDAQAAQSTKQAYAEYQQSRRLGAQAELEAKAAALGATEDSRTAVGRGVVVTGQDRVAINRASELRAKRAGGGGAGSRGGKSDAEREAERQNKELDKLDKALDGVMEKLQLEASLIGKSSEEKRIANELRRASVDATSKEGKAIAAYVTQIEAAEKAADRLASVQEYMAQTSADLFTDAISGADSFADSLRGIAGQLGQMLAENAFQQIFGGGQQGGGFGGSILGAIFGSLGAAGPKPGALAGGIGQAIYANGTNNHPGGPAIINDRGGEIAIMPSGSKVIPHDLSVAMLQGGRQTTDVRVAVEVMNDGGVRAYVKDQTSKAEQRAIAGVQKGNRSSRRFLGR